VKGFTRYELEQRRELDYPPYTRLALVRFEGADDALTQREALRIAKVAKHGAEMDVEVLGPAPAPIPRLRGRYRHRFMLRAKDRNRLHLVLLAVARSAVDRRVRMAIDVDPVSML